MFFYIIFLLITSTMVVYRFLWQAQQRLSGVNLEGMDAKSWKSVVLPKIYEEKMQKLEGELEKKVYKSINQS